MNDAVTIDRDAAAQVAVRPIATLPFALTIRGAQPAGRALDGRDQAAYLAGGTNLIDLMEENVAPPLAVVDINRLQLAQIMDLDSGGLRLGARDQQRHCLG